MRIELLPGTTNVIRFPVELRLSPTLDLLCELAPDVREVLNMADAFALEAPTDDIRERADEDAAALIAMQAPACEPGRAAMLCNLETSALHRAIDACRHHQTALHDAREAQDALVIYEKRPCAFWIDVLRQRSDAAVTRAAILLLQAHERSEEAFGVARAVAFARSCKAWGEETVKQKLTS